MVERRSGEQFINLEPYAYQRFTSPGVRYLLPLNPSVAQVQIQKPRLTMRKYLKKSSLNNLKHTKADPIPVYTLPRLANGKSNPEIEEHINNSVRTLGETLPKFQTLASMLRYENELFYGYRGADITVGDLALERREQDQPDLLNKLVSLATYGLDYPPQHSGFIFGNISISISDLTPAIDRLSRFSPLPKNRTEYSLLMIYTSEGLDYYEDIPTRDDRGVKKPNTNYNSYAAVITDNETLRDKLQAVVIIPRGDEIQTQSEFYGST